MAIAALIKYDQGASHPPAGQALIGTLGVVVTASNGDNADVKRWEWEWRATPTGSTILPGIIASGQVPTINFTPDVRGTYVLVLRVYDRFGNVREDERCFSVLETTGRLIPNFDADASSMNFGGQKFGWHPYIEAHLKAITGGGGIPPSVAMPANNVDWSAGDVFTKTLAAGANTFTFSNTSDGQTIVVIVTGAASTLAWPTVKWAGGTPPTQTASGIDVYTFVKAGSTIYGSVVQALS